VGEVEKVSLRQPSPREPARVELALLIEDPKITLREADVFEIVSDGLLGDSYVRVTAAAETSEPLSPGATVAGRSPFVSRVLESTSNALDALADLAKQSRDAMLDALARAAEAEAEEEQALP
jgi:ABC-type transporter Mla subunit MlaD